MRPSKRHAIRTYLENVDISAIISAVESCEEKITILETIVRTGLDYVLPLKTKTVFTTEPPWINPTLKRFIKSRQRALNQGNHVELKLLRNQINRERKICRSRSYENKVQHLKECNPACWWKEIKRLGGVTNLSGARDNVLRSIHHLEGVCDLTPKELANHINAAFLTQTQSFKLLINNPFGEENTQYPNRVTNDEILTISEMSVFQKLSTINATKAQGSDGIPGWLSKENADLLSAPVTNILDTFYSEGILPPSWKEADVVPVPKLKPIKDVNNHLRPISLTPILSKIAEDHIVEKNVKPAVLKKIDQRQFGTIPNSSTTHALISMTHNWLANTDGNGATARVALLDFRKAFDLIDHNILMRKLSSYDMPKPIKNWFADFLTLSVPVSFQHLTSPYIIHIK